MTPKLLPLLLVGVSLLSGCLPTPEGYEDPYSLSQGIKESGMTDTRMNEEFSLAKWRPKKILVLPVNSSVMSNSLGGLSLHSDQSAAMNFRELKLLTEQALVKRGYVIAEDMGNNPVSLFDIGCPLGEDYASIRTKLFMPNKIDIEEADSFEAALNRFSPECISRSDVDAIFIVKYAKWYVDDEAKNADFAVNLATALIAGAIGANTTSTVNHREGEYFESAMFSMDGNLLWSRVTFNEFHFDGGVIDWSLEQLPNFNETAPEMRTRIIKQMMGCDRPGTVCY
ncbi:hypothetical protein ACFSJ3_12390 [Corallincola platygyrae]|uniref:Lipoprotein n=1 Tax=Corallincola platygyrae TaxID=1193278 RepID=A0ABW4XMG4_9GAMM